MILSACFYADKSRYPNIGETDWQRRNEVYWRCMAVMVISARRFGGHQGRIIIFTNDRPIDEYSNTFARYDVELLDIPFTYRPPDGYYHSFIGAFYLLDAIDWASENLAADDSILFIDPDCLVTDDISSITRLIQDAGIVAYDQNLPIHYQGNGLSRADIWDLERKLFDAPASPSAPRWLGGELLGLRRDKAVTLTADLKAAWAQSLSAFEQGLHKFNTEEQILSAVIHARGHGFFDAGDGYIRRIWTTSVHRKYLETDVNLPIWHLPAEKKYGFSTAWNILSGADDALFNQPRELRQQSLAKIMNLRGNFLREATYLARWTLSRLANLVAGKINRYE